MRSRATFAYRPMSDKLQFVEPHGNGKFRSVAKLVKALAF